MKKFVLISMIIFTAIFFGCDREKPNVPDPEDPNIVLIEPVQPTTAPTPIQNGAVIIGSIGGDVKQTSITITEEYPEGSSTKSAMSAKRLKSSLKAGDGSSSQVAANDYRFKLVNHKSALEVPLDGQTVSVQATHVKITDDGYVFVSYNKRDEPNIGGLVVYRYVVSGTTRETATVELFDVPDGVILMPHAQINAIDWDGSKLYLAGASDDLKLFGNKVQREDPAFLMVMELDANKSFKTNEPKVKQLTSFQSTSIRKYKDYIYIPTGDGTDPHNTGVIRKGGLHIYKASDCSFVKAILGDDYKYARSVDVDNDHIFLMQSYPARVRKFDLDGSNGQLIYDKSGNAMQLNAKTEILAWSKYLFVSENESGLKMITKSDGEVNDELDAPNKGAGNDWNPETDVTNSVSMNSDPKKAFDSKGKPYDVNSDLLLVANGEQGVYWYDIARTKDSEDVIAVPSVNSVLADPKAGNGNSANFIASVGNVVFVAHGIGGLKVLYIDFNPGDEPEIITTGQTCKSFMDYIYDGTDVITPLFPEEKSVFRSDAHAIVKQLFQLDTDGVTKNVKAARDLTLNHIKITKETELFITFMWDGAGFANALGYFVIPESAKVPENDIAEYNYWLNTVKPKMVTNVGTTSKPVYKLNDNYIIFKNIHGIYNTLRSGGFMLPGNTYQVGALGQKFNAGDRVVIFMCPDSWKSQNNRVEVQFTENNNDQIFFMHKYFNEITKIRYHSNFGDFKGQQVNSFYSADCSSLVLMIEDCHWQWSTTASSASDCDFNDVIFSLSDNLTNDKVTSFEVPYWAVGRKTDNPDQLIIFESSESFKNP